MYMLDFFVFYSTYFYYLFKNNRKNLFVYIEIYYLIDINAKTVYF